MASPYVRRQQLAVGLIEAREAAGMTHAQLAARIGQSRQKISRLENGHVKPDQADIFKILDVLGVEGEQWAHMVEIAGEAAEKGWWASYGESMGARQAVYADLESGAKSIREFQPFIPGLLQTPDFAEARHIAEFSGDYQLDSAAAARQTRQRMMMRSGGPTYEVVIDEVAIRRPLAPSAVVATQLHRLQDYRDDPRITVRVLPVDAQLRDYRVVRSAFSLYTYPGPKDPEVVAVDTVTADMVLTTLSEAEQVRRYLDLYDRITEAALSRADSADLLSATAEQLLKGAGR